MGGVYETPSWDHWLGTDDLGRDNLSRIIYGARVSLRSGIQIVGIALVFAIPIGLLAGFRGGGVDLVSMRIMDGVSAFPPLVLALAVVGMLGAGLSNAILAISIVVIPGFTRLIRAQTLAVRQEPFIEASLAMGTKPGRVRRKRILPNVASPLIVAVSLAFGGALIAEASLSVLGFGVEAPDASWGSMINKARIALYEHPWLVFVPSGVLVLTILAFNTLGDGIRDALGLGLPKGKQAVRGKLGLTTVERAAAGARVDRDRRRCVAARGAGPLGRVRHRAGARHRGRPRELLGGARRGRRAGRRVGLGEDRHLARGDATGRVTAGPDHERLGAPRWP